MTKQELDSMSDKEVQDRLQELKTIAPFEKERILNEKLKLKQKEKSDRMKKIGSKAYIFTNGMYFEVYVMHFKERYGKLRWLVRPVSGYANEEVWVEKIQFIE